MSELGRINWHIWFDRKDSVLVAKIEEVRRAKGMTKKGFILYAIANMVPELAPEIIDHLMQRPASGSAKTIRKDFEHVANTD